MLDVGTGSGVLALAALMMGVPRALAIDIDDEALRIAAENARINALDGRCSSRAAGQTRSRERGRWSWPTCCLARSSRWRPRSCVASAITGQLVLSGIPSSVERDVDQAYRHLGMRRMRVKSRAGWIALVLRASW